MKHGRGGTTETKDRHYKIDLEWLEPSRGKVPSESVSKMRFIWRGDLKGS